MKKDILFILLLVLGFESFGQTKKNQIEDLTKKSDSLEQVILFERKGAQIKKFQYDSTVQQFEVSRQNKEKMILKQKETIDSFNTELRGVNLKMHKVNQERLSETAELLEKINSKISENLALQKQLFSLADSLKMERSINNNYASKTSEETEVTFKKLNKPSNATMIEVTDWLNQFTIISEQSTFHYDLETAKFYGGESASIEMFGKVTLKNTLFQEGIVFNERYEHEGSLYQLFIPVLEIQDVKRLIDRLCKNMGGCVSADDMEVTYEKTDFGVKVLWGGGC
jgi:hypothetical protein